MPRFRKLSPNEIAANQFPISDRALVTRQYDALLADVALGEYGRAELVDGEQRTAVRSRLHAAARWRGFALRFRHGPSAALIFRVEAVPAAMPLAPTSSVRSCPSAARDTTASPKRAAQAAGRYDDVLPRWMREEQPTGQHRENKRRGR